jgi:hypothetical protein
MPELWKDLSLIPDSIKKGNSILKNDYGFKVKSSEDEAYVFSMYGGGNDFGFFALPQPNSLGIVSTIENETNERLIEYVWLGSVSFMNGTSINLPSNNEKDKNGVAKGSNSISPDGFVIKTKKTNYLNYNSVKSEDLDFANKPFTNLIAVTDKGIELYYRNATSTKNGPKILGTSKVKIDMAGLTGEFYPYKDNSPDTDTCSKFYIKPNGEVQLERHKKDQASCTIKTGSEVDNINNKEVGVIRLSVNGKNISSDLKLQDNSIECAVNGNSLQLSAENGIIVTAAKDKTISFEADRINLGPNNKSVVLVDNAFAEKYPSGFRPDGVIFFASGVTKG